ncbi:Cdh7 [Phodopus roborovskii]|uniref:Cdh7 protein n=1 Tax=Phodopus roborovskii TaxID=109678 RepID=A0AAV0A420_PHORO|nr:Cdh7 [Phodopus roborovskii]
MKLGKVELCHFLQLIALFLCFSGMSQAELPRSRSKPYFQPGKSRTKRSWVWNQFFVLEEYMGSDPLYVGKVWHLAFQSFKGLLSMSLIG